MSKNTEKKLDTNNLAKLILRWLWDEDDEKSPFDIQNSAMFFMRRGWSFRLNQEQAKIYQESLRALLSNKKINTKFSEKFIKTNFEELLIVLLEDYSKKPSEQEVKKKINEWLNNLFTKEAHTISYYTIIDNLVTDRSTEIGHVRIQPINSETIGHVRESYFTVIDNNPELSPEEKERYKTQDLDYYIAELESSRNSSLISTTVEGVIDTEKGWEIAYSRFGEAVDLLRVFGWFLYRDLLKRRISLRGQEIPTDYYYFSFSPTRGSSFAFKYAKIPYELDEQALSIFNNYEFSFFSSILSKEDERTEFQNRLVNAIQWASEAIKEPSQVEQFLKAVISIESLVTEKSKDPIASTVAERLAFLIGGDNEKRKAIYKKAKNDIYSTRSKIAHEGKPEDKNDLKANLPYAIAYSVLAILAIAKLMKERNFETFKDLLVYFEDLKFNTP